MAHGLIDLDSSAFEVLRIEAGVPASGRDVTPDNLPQEVARDSQAINFVKGCYLGQETVARIDALGHVNKLLRGIIITGDRVPST
jgi:folate-binding protein YgfZ